jgi:apolipoprotein N-acyltransferase
MTFATVRFGPLVAALLGVVSAFAFQPVGWWPLMPVAFAGLCELLLRAGSLRRALLIGWLFGLGQFVVGLNWIATAFTYQAAMPAWLGWIAVVLLSLYLALYPALAAGLGWRLGAGRQVPLLLALSGGWAVTEWLRAGIFTGFAWNPVGVVLAGTPLLQSSALIGTYGLSMLVVLIGGALWLATHRKLAAVAIPAAILLVWAWPTPPVHHSLVLKPVRIVQPNIGQQDKWRPGFSEIAAQRLARLSAPRHPDGPARLLLWPEAAITEPLEDARTDEHQAFAEFERTRAASLLTPGEFLLTGGIALHSSDGRRVDGAANSVFVLGPDGKVAGRYDKAHLVPYGEYLPMRPLLSSIGLSRLAPGDVDFTPGPGPRTLALPGWGKVGFQLCYEIIFSGQVVDRRNRPDFIFNPSNDAWFGRWGPPQHLAQARLRAAEEGIPVLRSTPTGISAIIDARGAIVASLPWRTAGVIDGVLPQPVASPTPFARAGNLIPLLLAFMMIAAAIALPKSERYRRT